MDNRSDLGSVGSSGKLVRVASGVVKVHWLSIKGSGGGIKKNRGWLGRATVVADAGKCGKSSQNCSDPDRSLRAIDNSRLDGLLNEGSSFFDGVHFRVVTSETIS